MTRCSTRAVSAAGSWWPVSLSLSLSLSRAIRCPYRGARAQPAEKHIQPEVSMSSSSGINWSIHWLGMEEISQTTTSRYRRQFAEASGGCGANAAMVLLVLPGVVSPGFAIRARHAGDPATRQLLLGVRWFAPARSNGT